MNHKQIKNLSLRLTTIEKIKVLSDQEGEFESAIVDRAIEAYYKDKEEYYHMMKEMISEVFDEKFSNIDEKMKRIWLTGNVIDRHTKMMMEFWNHYFVVGNFDMFASTKQIKSSMLDEAERIVKGDIQAQRKRKLTHDENKKAQSS